MKKVENYRYRVAALHKKAKGGGNESIDYESGGEEEVTSNRGHTTLICKNKKQKKGKSS